jgi:uncharacterized membrane protein
MTEGTTPRDPGEEPAGQAPPPPPQAPPPPPPPPAGGPEWGEPGGYQGQPGYQPQPGYQQQSYQQPPPGYQAPPPPGYQPQPASSGLSENVASGLSYVVGWLTGLIFYLIDKRPEVRFHAMQSIVFSVVAMLVGWIRLFTSGFLATLLWLVSVVFFFTWIFVMIQAFQGRHFKLPLIGDFAEQQARPS